MKFIIGLFIGLSIFLSQYAVSVPLRADGVVKQKFELTGDSVKLDSMQVSGAFSARYNAGQNSFEIINTSGGKETSGELYIHIRFSDNTPMGICGFKGIEITYKGANTPIAVKTGSYRVENIEGSSGCVQYTANIDGEPTKGYIINISK